MISNMKSRWERKIRNSFYTIATIMLILILWQMTIIFFSLPEFILPGPIVVIKYFFSRFNLLYSHASITIFETLVGLTLAIIFAIIMAILVVWSKTVEETIMPLLVFFQTTPKIAVAPLFLVWFGFGYLPKIIICFWLAYFPIAISTITGLRDVQPEMIDLTKSMSATTLQTFIKVRIPNSLPYFFSGLKLGGLVAVLGSVVGEFVGSDKGLGFLLTMAIHNRDVKLLFADVMFMAILGRLIYAFVSLIEKNTISWNIVMRTQENKVLRT